MTDRDPRHRLTDWFRQWRLPLRKYLSRKGSIPASDLDDVAQEVFLRLMRYERTELVENPQAYLFKMAGNVAAEWAIRGRQVQLREPQWLSEFPAEQPSADQFRNIELQDEIERALLTLSPQQRQVLKLQFFEGLSRPDIAVRLSLTERSVKRALMKSYEKLRRELSADLLRGLSDGRE